MPSLLAGSRQADDRRPRPPYAVLTTCPSSPHRLGDARSEKSAMYMRGVRCITRRPPLDSQHAAAAIAARVVKGAQALHCPYCGWWHVVGYGSPIEHPSKARRRR